MIRPDVVWVVAVALVAHDGRVLMAKRKQGRAHGGLWEFPGGKMEAGESPEAAALREIREELGVNLSLSALEPIMFASSSANLTALGAPHIILLYACREWHGQPRCLDAEDISWFAPDQLHHLAMPPLDYPLARALNQSLELHPI